MYVWASADRNKTPMTLMDQTSLVGFEAIITILRTTVAV